MAFAILNGSLSPITCNIIRLDFDGVCHVTLMRPDYERSTRGRPPLQQANIVLCCLDEEKLVGSCDNSIFATYSC